MLSLSNSDERGARFNLNSSTLYPICNGDHKEETIWNNIKGEWGSGEYCGEQTYRQMLECSSVWNPICKR
ncbi:hypothetical protein RclHR1_14280007 [Rhizophagus clarus]|uniref:Uncharacterized protein n=1 Tax=Rhizophagus clarus TaxID=94130 RepID=A0A2Z6R4R5_9GLOM|nr:hypothetical protein RclHR1_14280007 [Rhizophagus clarus]